MITESVIFYISIQNIEIESIMYYTLIRKSHIFGKRKTEEKLKKLEKEKKRKRKPETKQSKQEYRERKHNNWNTIVDS